LGTTFVKMSNSHRVLWLRTFLAKRCYMWGAWQLVVDPFVQCLPLLRWQLLVCSGGFFCA
jgi:hypothetical protein